MKITGFTLVALRNAAKMKVSCKNEKTLSVPSMIRRGIANSIPMSAKTENYSILAISKFRENF
jgi:hypothetical protein